MSRDQTLSRTKDGAVQAAAAAAGSSEVPGPDRPSAALRAAGRALRDKLPRHDQGVFKRDKKVDALAILRAGDQGRVKQLLPIRYGRMLQSPFTFFRGSAAVMAADLARTPSTGIHVQACGDCHLMNFGGFATPERNILFDINDFDETAQAPWEWDLKRLTTSFMLAARSIGLPDAKGRDIATSCARSYRKHLEAYSEMSPLDVWYSRITLDDLVEAAPAALRKSHGAALQGRIKKATADNSSELVYPELAGMVGGQIRIHDAPPLIFHPDDMSADEWHALLEAGLRDYQKTLAEDRRMLLDQYRLVDGAVKVVGIGSVGTRCLVILLMSANNDPLFLQWKEAGQSVLEPYAGKSAYPHPGQRVVMGQRLMQPATDVFMGWATGRGGKRGYMRQLRDVKIKPLVETMDAAALSFYAKMCGWVLARAHTKASARELEIAGYLGGQDNFDAAMGRFAVAYADQAERDHAMLKKAVRAGKIAVHTEA
ncbi:DUF2252 domain-containing protein [Dongia sp. agr-C8]